MIFALISGIIGTTLSVIIRSQLAGYTKTDSELYNVVVTMHGLIMIFLCDSVLISRLFPTQERGLVRGPVKEMTNLNPKGGGDKSMSLNYHELKPLKTRCDRNLDLTRLNLDWLKPNSSVECISN